MKQINDSLRVFHARIFRLYLDYLREMKGFTVEAENHLLSKLEVSAQRLRSDDSWFDVQFADKFYHEITELFPGENIAFEAGAYIKRNTFSASVYYLLRGLILVKKVYQLIERHQGYFSKAARIKVVKILGNSAILESKPLIEGIERPYMCENRKGMLTGAPQIFDLPPAKLVETSCIHRGDNSCIYSIHWKEHSISQRIFRFLAIVSLIVGVFAYLLPLEGTIVLGVVLLLSVSGYFLRDLFKRQNEEFAEHNEALEESIQENEKRARELEVISTISKQTNKLGSPDDIADSVVRSVCQYLGYDRCLLMSSDFNTRVLKMTASFGFPAETQKLLLETEFNIRPDNTTGFFIKVVNTKKPVLIQRVEKEISQLSSRSRRFAEILGARSFVAVPLIDVNGEVMGVLAADYTSDEKVMNISDQDLLMTLADHISIAVHNANTLESLEKSLKLSKIHSQRHQELSKNFEKFVPVEMASQLSSIDDEQMRDRLLHSVQNKIVSVLFLDIFEFSALSQKLEAEAVVDMLNTIFEFLDPIIVENAGFIDKFTGDGCMAIFKEPDSATNSVRAAVKILGHLDQLSQKLKDKDYPSIDIGMGLHKGPAILGNIGSQNRINFTAIGSTINLAARLESHTRILGANSICASKSIVLPTHRLLNWRDLGMISLKGFEHGVEAYAFSKENLRAKTEGLLSDQPQGTSEGNNI